MKRIALLLALFLAACSGEQAPTFQTGAYRMVDSLNNVPTVIRFSEDGKINGQVVNLIMGEYKLGKKNSLTITPSGTTMMMGSPEEMEAEQNFLQILPRIRAYKMQGRYLTMITDNGGELLFAPDDTPPEESTKTPQE